MILFAKTIITPPAAQKDAIEFAMLGDEVTSPSAPPRGTSAAMEDPPLPTNGFDENGDDIDLLPAPCTWVEWWRKSFNE